jgi:hypothetical protein
LLISHVGYSYVGGRPDDKGFRDSLAPLLFDEALPRLESRELILFAFSDAWREQLDALLRHWAEEM